MSGWLTCVQGMCRVEAWVAALAGAWGCCGSCTVLEIRQALAAPCQRQQHGEQRHMQPEHDQLSNHMLTWGVELWDDTNTSSLSVSNDLLHLQPENSGAQQPLPLPMELVDERHCLLAS